MFQDFKGVEITAIATCVPKKTVGNDSFGELLSAKELRLFEKTVGILERRWVEDGVTASDLSFAAAEALFAKYPSAKNDIDCLIFLSQSPDYKIPFTSNILQDRLGLKRGMLCLDINAGCAGFVQGLATAFALAQTVKGKVLLITAETMSRMLSKKDRATTMLFGDGAAAVLIGNTGNQNAISNFNFFTDGANADAIIIPDGGYRNPTTDKSFEPVEDEKLNVKNRLNLSMDGARVFDFTLREITPSLKSLLEKVGKTTGEIEYFLLHQSNRFILAQIATQLGIPMDKMLVNIEKYGNTSSVSIPLLMASHREKLSGNQSIALCGYGVGLNWANAVLENTRIDILETVSI
ncbi:MAG: ketoacyl-ACP synthase III [Flavobacterium sp.]|uniref:ketoacyl-ACP synthase III n=1 Tax=Flavobacterium sp. TaxID=239 RepID=UPI0012074F3F|nr:ketoacyl-ACP synthase III [Flavobacterium sp.]RZJ66056.1 MAG: ketoacyl-ACP synthase III [Flavobacterium sp.]